MKIGVYLPEEKPNIGGTSTVLGNLCSIIENKGIPYELCVIYKGSIGSRYKYTKDGVDYVNLNRFKAASWLICKIKQIKYSLYDLREKLWMRLPIKSRVSYIDLLAEKEEIDIIWFTLPVCEILNTPYIFPVWDLGHRILPMYPEMRIPSNEWDEREMMYQRMLPKASYIITGNEVGKGDILKNFCVSDEHIYVADFMTPDLSKCASTKPNMIPENFYFYPAQFWAHKNHIIILDALKVLKDKYKIIVNVVFTGKDYGTQEYIEKKSREYGVDNQVFFLGFVSREEIKYLYQHAKSLIFPSLLGPNNLPPLEAISLDCPVIISSLKGHMEQLGDAALFFDGDDPDDLAEKIIYMENEDNRIKAIDMCRKYYANKIKNAEYIDVVIEILGDFEKQLHRWK